MGCTREEVTTIKINRRLLLTAAVGAVLILSAVLIVTMPGNDKPRITDNLPADDEESQDTPTAPVVTPSDVPNPDANDPDDDAQTEPEDPDDDEDDDDQGDDDDDNPPSDDKARGLARAIQAHEKNIQKCMDKGKDVPKGLQMSMDKLTAKYDAQQADLGDDEEDDDEDKDNGQGQDKDHSNNGDNGKHNGKGQSEGT